MQVKKTEASKQLEYLVRAHAQGMLHHAYGIVGDFQKTFIECAIQTLLCTEKTTSEPCMRCRSCVAAMQHVHPDIWIHETVPGEAISIDRIRELQRYASTTPQMSSMMMVAVTDAQQLTTSAANALLKTIEEPPEHTILFFGTQNAYALPATVRSRMHILYLPPQPYTPNEEENQFWTDFLHGSLFDRIALIQKAFPKKMDSLELQKNIYSGIVLMQYALRNQLYTNEGENQTTVAQKIKILYDVQRKLRHNVNKKMLLDHLIISL